MKREFILLKYQLSSPLFPQLKASNVMRLIYLSTYLSKNNYLISSNNKPMSRQDICMTLNMSKRGFESFMKETCENDIMFRQGSKWYINSDIFCVRMPSQKQLELDLKKGLYFIRLYCDGIQKLYKSATTRSHKTLSYIFQMIPYINRKYNILCWNPLETDINKVQAIRLGEYCDLIGYNPTNVTRLFNILFEPTFVLPDGSTKCAVRYVADKSTQKKTYKIFINPRVYYAGDDWEQVEVLGGF